MKKSLIFAAIAAVALSACAKFETFTNTNEDNAIRFSAYSSKSVQTRGGATGVMDLDAVKTNGFGVFAYYTAAGNYDNNESTGSTPNFMYNEAVTWSTDKWVTEIVKYWPNNDNAHTNGSATTDKLSFFAYAPHTTTFTGSGITALTANTAKGAPKVTYTVATNPAQSVDLLYSDAATQNLTKQTVSGTVAFTFKHALTKLGIKVRGVFDATSAPSTADVDAATKIYVNSVSITTGAIPTGGVLNLETGAWTPTAGNATLAIAAANIPAALKTGGAGVSKTAASLLNDGEFFMLLPDASAQNYDITINYTVETTDAKLNGGKSTVVNEITKRASIRLEQGKGYTFLLDLGMTTVKLSASVTDWDEQSDTEIWLPVNNS